MHSIYKIIKLSNTSKYIYLNNSYSVFHRILNVTLLTGLLQIGYGQTAIVGNNTWEIFTSPVTQIIIFNLIIKGINYQYYDKLL